MDDFLKDLESWKAKRADFLESQSNAPEETKEVDEVDEKIQKLEEEFVEKANMREKKLLDQL